jgi:uncharacterized protein (TIGR02266 family)
MKSGAGAKQQVNAEPMHNRAAERYDLEIAVDLNSASNFYTGLTRNISSGGLFIATHRIKRIGDLLRVKFTLPHTERPIEVDAEVRWIRENSSLLRTESAMGMGVRFLNTAPEDAALIQSFIQYRESLFFDDE